MLKNVDISNAQGGFISLQLQDTSSGIVVKSIDGLDPVKATMVSSSFTNMDGEQYHSSRRDKRNIILTLGLDPEFTSMGVRELRQYLYSVMMPKSPVNLAFYDTDGTFTLIDGRVESMESPMFTEDPEVQVSILCFNPDFVDPNPVVVSGSSTTTRTETLIHYNGTVETGVLVTVKANAATSAISLDLRSQGRALQNAFTDTTLASGSSLLISSVPGDKYVRLRAADSSESSALQAYSPFSAWLTLWPGDNYFMFQNSVSTAASWSMQFINRYGGL